MVQNDVIYFHTSLFVSYEDGHLDVSRQTKTRVSKLRSKDFFLSSVHPSEVNQSVNIQHPRPDPHLPQWHSRVNRYRLVLAGRESITPDLPSPSPQCHASLISLTGAPAPTQMTRGGGVRGTTTPTSCSRVWRSSSRRLAAASSSSLLSCISWRRILSRKRSRLSAASRRAASSCSLIRRRFALISLFLRRRSSLARARSLSRLRRLPCLPEKPDRQRRLLSRKATRFKIYNSFCLFHFSPCSLGSCVGPRRGRFPPCSRAAARSRGGRCRPVARSGFSGAGAVAPLMATRARGEGGATARHSGRSLRQSADLTGQAGEALWR